MSPELISIFALVACFVLATTMSVNMGVLSFAAAFAVGKLAGGLSDDDIFAGFPGDIFVVLVGVTYLFAIARANGTTDWLVHWAVRLVGGRLAVIPWVMFGIAALLTAIGAVSPAACAIIAPIALNLAARHGINPLLMGAMVVHGAQAGGFSPISVYGVIVNGVVADNGLAASPLVLFLGSFAVNLAIAAVVFVVFGGLRTARADTTAAPDDSADEPECLRLTRDRVLTLLGLAALVVCTLVFELDAGLVAMSVAVVLTVISPKTAANAPAEVTWPTVLLICGVLTYVSVLQEMGTIDYVGHAVAGVGLPLLAALLLCYIGGVVSAFASSVGLMGALIPLAVPFLATGTIGPIGMVTALAVSATLVDVSPFSTNGAIVLANAKGVDRDVFFRRLMIYGGVIVAVGPLVAWLIFVLPGLG
ncbi:SLC13 family permease [Saccharopolyspora gloriosae]|uniref:Na+/H+ antiporter NhaD/arsenite permease-like protein n=1 Tax=Saccharopolyspora gloriosae TaxID=455344 RepID=A0A840NIA7_9PSEU|nr:Na+/H+ antiporter NhaD/arsenite permease-like protein [Saccharopolyspora gloriosae]